jgi:hypothetical protein
MTKLGGSYVKKSDGTRERVAYTREPDDDATPAAKTAGGKSAASPPPPSIAAPDAPIPADKPRKEK